jgi:hypothetical protein
VVQHRQKFYKNILARLKPNIKPLDKYSCNFHLSITNIFRKKYNGDGDKMLRDSKKFGESFK